jgi:hypothetical protein
VNSRGLYDLSLSSRSTLYALEGFGLMPMEIDTNRYEGFAVWYGHGVSCRWSEG